MPTVAMLGGDFFLFDHEFLVVKIIENSEKIGNYTIHETACSNKVIIY